MIKIKEEKPAKRCEICHKSDCFDEANNYCSRCRESGNSNQKNSFSAKAQIMYLLNQVMKSVYGTITGISGGFFAAVFITGGITIFLDLISYVIGRQIILNPFYNRIIQDLILSISWLIIAVLIGRFINKEDNYSAFLRASVDLSVITLIGGGIWSIIGQFSSFELFLFGSGFGLCCGSFMSLARFEPAKNRKIVK